MYLKTAVEILDTLAYEFTNEFLFIVHMTKIPGEGDWARMVEHTNSHPALRGAIVLAPETKPTPAMRADIQAMYERFGTKTAVLTTSMVSKGVMRALSWFNVPMKGFSPYEIAEACEYLGRPDMVDYAQRLLGPYVEAPLQASYG